MNQAGEEQAPPDAPASVVAVEANSDALLLGWDEVPDAVAYELQMGCVRVCCMLLLRVKN